MRYRARTHCNCSSCTKRGTLAAYYAPGEVELGLTPESLAAYQWGDRMMTFHHCTTCGCFSQCSTSGRSAAVIGRKT